MRRLPLAFALTATAPLTFASPIEEMVIQDTRPDRSRLAVDLDNHTSGDAATLLHSVPGANVNRLGALTGIAQYRGMYGDRVSVHIDGGPIYTGGPNAMDAPLSYAPANLLGELTVTRGIASVSAGQETIGGHITANLDRGEFGRGGDFAASGLLGGRYLSVSDGTSTALRAVAANRHHKFAALYSNDRGDDSDYADGTLSGTQYQRTRCDLSYGYQSDDHSLLTYVGSNQTRDAGTPALAMDIDYIDTKLAGFNFTTTLGDTNLAGYLSWSEVAHGMDNFSHRQPPMAMMQRHTQADAEHLAWGLSGTWVLAGGQLEIGLDGSRKDQHATVTNPNNGLFAIANFNGIHRNIDGAYAEWRTERDSWTLEAGVRHNRAELDADTVSAAGMMGMMAMNANMLAMAFNRGERQRDFSHTDLVLKTRYALSADAELELGVARKHRAPSYQEVYLWLPMPVTGGLADGRSYIGNLDLNQERANEFTLGLNWDNGTAYLSPQAFFRDVSDYIQGTPALNMTANVVANMMGGAPALQFNNVDAELYGLDAGYGYRLNPQWRLDGAISYVQGQRSDAADYLYRIAPLNHRLTLSYRQGALRLVAESILYDAQDRESAFNNEQRTAGYGLINLHAHYKLNPWVALSAGVENLLDQGYQDHLAGYNRTLGSDLVAGERMYGAGQNIYLAVQLRL